MPFGLCNAPATFERLMETVLKGLTFEACLIYLDDVIIGGRTFEEHLQNSRKVLSKLSDANLKLNPSKCKCSSRKKSIIWGHIISAEGVRTGPRKSVRRKELKRPENLRELRSFLGLCTYYRKLVKGFSNIARPLHKLTEKILEGQVARWIQRLNEYYFDIRHRKGSSHGNADALSRRPCPENCRHCSRVETKYDYAIRQITIFNSDATRSLENGVLYRKFESEDGKTFRWQLVLPRSRIPEVLKELHGSPTGGHFGVMKTLHRVRERFFWGKVRADVEQWCKSCDACAARKGPKIRSRGKLHRYNVGAPFERIAFDILGPSAKDCVW
ncbi:retrovirus-related Pol polyprotein from transposon 17.6 [Trichonephila clavipes]|nr:retrovirus-related Pol polyprotein from transposon 17.6 [Trichonephila clavipes]